MALFRKTDNTLVLLNAVQPESEKTLQRLIEANLETVLGIHFLISEYRILGGRIDTLGIDNTGAPTIIEYKLTKDNNVISQSLFYLQRLTAQPSELFEMLMQKYLPENILKSIRLDWRHPRIVCIADEFSRFDIATAEIVPLRIDLFKYRWHQDDVLSVEPVMFNKMQKILVEAEQLIPVEISLSEIQAMKERSSESNQIHTLFDNLREKIMLLDRYVVEKTNKKGVSYRLSKIFAEVLIRKTWLVINLRPIAYEDPQGLVKKIEAGYTVTMNRRIVLFSQDNLNYALNLIEQSYQNVL